MALFILALILWLVAVIAIITAVVGSNRVIPVIVAVIAVILGFVFFFSSTFYTNGVGEAKVKVSYTGQIDGDPIITPGSGFKSPFDNTVDFNLFSQNIKYIAGGNTDYSGGTVDGPQITSAVQGGSQTNFDLSVVYSLDSSKVKEIYSQFQSQENFTKKIIEPAIRSTTRDVPGLYSAVEFRTTKHAEAQQKIQDALAAQLSPYGVKIEQVNLQEVRYNDQVEAALSAVTAAEQSKAAAEANLEAAKITAQQNGVISDSLTPVLIQQQYIEALKDIGANGNLVVVPDGSSPLINVGTGAAKQ